MVALNSSVSDAGNDIPLYDLEGVRNGSIITSLRKYLVYFTSIS